MVIYLSLLNVVGDAHSIAWSQIGLASPAYFFLFLAALEWQIWFLMITFHCYNYLKE